MLKVDGNVIWTFLIGSSRLFASDSIGKVSMDMNIEDVFIVIF